MTNKRKKILMAAITLIVLICLFMRYSDLPQDIPVQFNFQGQASNFIPKAVFAPVVTASLFAFNGFVWFIKKKDEEIGWKILIAFLIICAAVLLVSIL